MIVVGNQPITPALLSSKMSFYATTLAEAHATHGMGLDDHILVVCGGTLDRDTLVVAGFTNVVISNLDERLVGDEFAPYGWDHQDAEHLTVEPDSFDWVIVHAGLHHCRVPQQALAQMLMAGRRGVLVIEARDSLLVRASIALRITAAFEIEAVVDNGGTHGGVSNTGVPNFVYRWTEREVGKTVSSTLPGHDHDITFFYGWSSPTARLSMSRNPLMRALAPLLRAACAIGRVVLPHQGNCFGFLIHKSVSPKPWMTSDGDVLALDDAWVKSRYRTLAEARQARADLPG